MCNYQGYEFGAGRYPDSYCIDGRLHDADSDYLNEDDVPCPMCRREDAIEYWYKQWENRCAVSEPEPIDWDALNARYRECAVSLVDDIRKNRGIPLPQEGGGNG